MVDIPSYEGKNLLEDDKFKNIIERNNSETKEYNYLIDDGVKPNLTDVVYDKSKDRLISTERTAIEITLENNVYLKDLCQNGINKGDYTSENDLVSRW